MIYRCLACDIPLTVGMLPAHVAAHGWNLDTLRDQGMEHDLIDRTATHEFGAKGGPALLWMVRHLNPLVEEPDV